MRFLKPTAAIAALLTIGSPLAAGPLQAQATPPAATAPATPPRLIVAISVDQLSADLFAEYRNAFRGGFARLLEGQVFPAGYQAQAATETCPGHSTILTGSLPARTGIIANDWIDQRVARADKTVYCAEDPSVAGSTSRNYTVSLNHLRVPTLGDRMRTANPAARVVSVSGKDRAAAMLGGRGATETWWWNNERGSFVSYTGRDTPAAVTRTNIAVVTALAAPHPALDVPAFCTGRDRAIALGGTAAVGAGRLARAAGDRTTFRSSPELDVATLALATDLTADLRLGRGATTDLLAIGLSSTDYVGHRYGTRGLEMCLHMLALDRALGEFFAGLDRAGIDYQVVLTADHGGLDLPERDREHAAPHAARVDPALNALAIGGAIGRELRLTGPVLLGGNFGDVYLSNDVPARQRARVLALAVQKFRAHPQVHSVFTRAEIEAAPAPAGPPESWTLPMRVRASYDRERSGDLYVVLKPRVTPIADGTRGYVATHGSVWDYDRRVPILFWRAGRTGFEQPMGVTTADIMPTLAALIALPVPANEIDGRCLDLDAGPGTTCR